MALALHVLNMYLVVFLQSEAGYAFTAIPNMLIKLLLRWSYLIVPLIFMVSEKMSLRDIGITKDNIFLQVCVGAVLGIIAAFLIVFLAVALGFKAQLGQPIYSTGLQYVFYLFYTVFAVALFEEIFFRGYIFTKLLDINSSRWFAVIFSSISFGLCHFVGNGTALQAIPQVLLSTLIGIIYCLIREKIKNCTLISLITMHGIYDFLIAFLVYCIS